MFVLNVANGFFGRSVEIAVVLGVFSEILFKYPLDR